MNSGKRILRKICSATFWGKLFPDISTSTPASSWLCWLLLQPEFLSTTLRSFCCTKTSKETARSSGGEIYYLFKTFSHLAKFAWHGVGKYFWTEYSTEMLMKVSWRYVAADFQLFMLCSILLATSHRNKKIFFVLSGAIFACSLAAVSILGYLKSFNFSWVFENEK